MTGNFGSTVGASTRNGRLISVTEINAAPGSVGGLFTGTPWTVAPESLPGLFGKTTDMPGHLGGYFRVRYRVTAGGRILGDTVQTLDPDGGAGIPIAALPIVDDGRTVFISWCDGLATHTRVDSSNVVSDTVFTATFDRTFRTLRYTAGLNGRITGTRSQEVEVGGRGSPVTAIANDGYVFVGWSDGNTDPERADSNVTEDVAVTASFALFMHTLRYAAGVGGSVRSTGANENSLTQRVLPGRSGMNVTAVAASGYTFAGWSDGVITSARREDNVRADISVIAYFVPTRHVLRYALGAGGGWFVNGIGGGEEQIVFGGANGVEIYAVPGDGYTFVRWSDGDTVNPRTDRNVRASISVVALFEDEDGNVDETSPFHELSYAAEANGRVAGLRSQFVLTGSSGLMVAAIPNVGFEFLRWSDGVTDNPRVDNDVQGDIDVSAIFAVYVSVMADDRVVPVAGDVVIDDIIDNDNLATVAPAVRTSAIITVGPNPACRQSGNVNFYITEPTVISGSLTVYDASGNVVRRLFVDVNDNNAPVIGNDNRRIIATWDLRDRRNMIIAEGTYLVRGVINLPSGRRERVSVVVGVRQ